MITNIDARRYDEDDNIMIKHYDNILHNIRANRLRSFQLISLILSSPATTLLTPPPHSLCHLLHFQTYPALSDGVSVHTLPHMHIDLK